MINRISSIVGSVYYVGQAAEANKVTKAEKGFNELMLSRVAKVQKVARLNALNEQEKELKAQADFNTQVVTNPTGNQSVVLLASKHKYRQINLDGRSNQSEVEFINPAKVKAAYFNDDL